VCEAFAQGALLLLSPKLQTQETIVAPEFVVLAVALNATGVPLLPV